MISTVFSNLQGVRGKVTCDEPMRKHTTWRTGGHAELMYTPADKEDLAVFIKQLPRACAVHWLGLGSNVLVRDGGIKGVVIQTHKGLSEMAFTASEALYAEAGVPCAKAAKFAAKNERIGAEFLTGIPGTVGGAIAMNAGAFGAETWPLVKRILCIDRNGEWQWLAQNDVTYSYRHVEIPKGVWCVAAEFDLKRGKGAESLETMRALLRKRNDSQPVQTWNAGSVFKNPEGHFAAGLLEQCGLKGKQIGDAEFSTKHTNFIVNNGRASAEDIEQLITLGQSTVHDKLGVHLETEVRIIGEAL